MAQKLKNNLKKIFIKTFGCQMNVYDSQRIYDLAKKINFIKTVNLDEADCFVLNTCHIREKATDKVYHEVGRIKKKFKFKKKPIIVVTGCVAQAEGEILLNGENYIDAVLGPQSYHKFNETIIKIEKNHKKCNLTNFDVIEKFDTLNHIKNSNNDVSSFLTIQEGCDKFCKFCVVPYTRGPEFSRSIDELLIEAEALTNNGAKEITLLGQNVNAYNYKGKKLSNLIDEISKINNLKRIRYTTSHLVDFSKDLIEIHGISDKLMPLIHLPVQSGSNKILKTMNRRHTVEDYLDLVKRLRKINSSIKFSSDFIIGYPGETDNDFSDTLKLLNKVQFINTYSFIFSARPGTPAAKLKKIENSIAKERLFLFQKIAEKIKTNYKKSLINKNCYALFENKLKEGNRFFGKDELSNPVIVESKENLVGKIKEVKIIDANQSTLFGKICDKSVEKEFAA